MGDNVHDPGPGALPVSAYRLALQLDADVLVFEYPGFGHTQTYDGTLFKSLCCWFGYFECCQCACLLSRWGSCIASEDLVVEVLSPRSAPASCFEMVAQAFEATIDFATRSMNDGGLAVPVIYNITWYM